MRNIQQQVNGMLFVAPVCSAGPSLCEELLFLYACLALLLHFAPLCRRLNMLTCPGS
jgi:hypothetical protein